LTPQWKNCKLREQTWEIVQSMSISTIQHTVQEQRDLLLERCITLMSDLISKRLLWKWYMADKTHLNHQKLKAACDKINEVGIHRETNSIDKTSSTMWKFTHVGMTFIALKLRLLFFTMCKFRKHQERILRSQVITYNGAFRRLNRYPSLAILPSHHLCGSRHWLDDGWQK
jgi:hypothetical protein